MIFRMLVITFVVGVALWGFNEYVTKMDAKVKSLINAVVIIVLFVWWLLFLLHWAGISTGGL